MSQDIFSNIVPSTTSGTQLATLLNNFKDAIASGMSGTSRPANLQAGGGWIDTTLFGAQSIWQYKVYTGSADIEVFRLNLATNAVTVTGSENSFQISKTSADANAPLLKLLKERVANNGQVLIGDVVGEIQFIGAASDNTNPIVAKIKVVSSDDANATVWGGYFVFEEVNALTGTLSEKMRLKDGLLGIGTTSAEATVHAKGTTGIKTERESDDATGTKVLLKKKRSSGTGAVQSGDTLGGVEFSANYNTGLEDTTAKIEAIALETHSPTVRGTKLSVKIKKTGATVFTEKILVGDEMTFEGVSNFTTVKSVTEIVGGTTGINVPGSISSDLQVQSVQSAPFSIFNYSNDSQGPALSLCKSRGATIGSNSGLIADDTIGRILFSANNGAGFAANSVAIVAKAQALHAVGDQPGYMTFETTPIGSVTRAERVRVTSEGKFLVGHTDPSTMPGSTIPSLQIIGTSASTASSLAIRYSADTSGGNLYLAKSRGASAGVDSAILSGDVLGAILFSGNTGSGFTSNTAAVIALAAENFSGTNMGTSITFGTTPLTSSSRSERMRITSEGQVGINNSGVFRDTLSGLAVHNTSNICVLELHGSANSAIVAYGQGGTYSSPTATASGTTLGTWGGRGYDGSAYSSASKSLISHAGDGTWTGSSNPTRITFSTTPSGSTTTSEIARFDSSGNFGINTTTPAQRLSVVGNPLFQSSASSMTAAFEAYSTSSTGSALLALKKSDNDTTGTLTVTATDDRIGFINFQGVNSSAAFNSVAGIQAFQEAGVGVTHIPGRLVFLTSSTTATATERMRITSEGKVLIAGTSSITVAGGIASDLQVQSVQSAPFSILEYSNDSQGPAISVCKSRGTTVGSNSALLADDTIGRILFSANNGAGFVANSVAIIAKAAANHAVGDQPGHLTFETAPVGSATRSERMRITSEGKILVGGTTPITIAAVSAAVQIQGTDNPTGSFSLTRFSANTTGALNYLAKSRGTTVGSDGAVTSGDNLGIYLFAGNTGSSFLNGAGIRAVANSTFTTSNSESYLTLETTSPGATAISEKMRVTSTGSIILGSQAALATTATDGFTYIPTSAGAPTGVPTAFTGKVAMQYDTTNNRLYIYNGAWKSVVLA